MELAMGFFEIGDGQAQIALGGGEGAMPDDVLNVPEIGFVFDHVRGATVTPDMRRDVLFHFRQLGVFASDIAHRVRIDRVAAIRDEKTVGAFLAQPVGAGCL
jgi:hypothetical protein